MAFTTLFDNTVSGSAFDGTKTLAQMGLTDAQSIGSLAGGNLSLVGTATGYVNDYVTAGAASLYSRTTVSFVADTLGSAHLEIAVRRQTDNSGLFLHIPSGAGLQLYAYAGAGAVLTAIPIQNSFNANNVTGSTTVTFDVRPGVGAALDLIITLVNAGTTYHSSVLGCLLGPQAAGLVGVGAAGGTVAVTALKVESSNAVADPSPNLIVAVGDSLGFGYFTSNAPFTSHPYLLQAALNSGPAQWALENLSIPGITAATVDANFAAMTAPFFALSRTNKVGLVLPGTNDLTNGLTESQLQASLLSIISKMRAAGATKIGLATLTPHPAYQAAINTHNTWARSLPGGADFLLDYAAGANLTDATNTTYFNPDQLHLTDAGQTAMAVVDKAALTL